MGKNYWLQGNIEKGCFWTTDTDFCTLSFFFFKSYSICINAGRGVALLKGTLGSQQTEHQPAVCLTAEKTNTLLGCSNKSTASRACNDPPTTLHSLSAPRVLHWFMQAPQQQNDTDTPVWGQWRVAEAGAFFQCGQTKRSGFVQPGKRRLLEPALEVAQ